MDQPTVKILSLEEIQTELKKTLGWNYGDNKIAREFKFADFPAAVSFVDHLVSYFQTIDHHPDIHIYYNKVIFELTRYDIGGKVTDLDFIVAREINNNYNRIK